MRYLFYLLIFIIQYTSFGQSSAAFEKEGDKAFNKGNFYEAMMHYKSALEFSTNSDLYSKVGMAAFQSHSYNIAEIYLSKIIANKKLNRNYPDAAFYLAETYKYLGNYEQAKTLYSQFQNSNSLNKNLIEKSLQTVNEINQFGTIPNDTTVKLKKMEKINSEFSDFAPIKIGDSLYFSSMRFLYSNDKHTPKRVFAKIMLAKEDEKGKVINQFDPKDSTHVAHLTMNNSKDKIIFTKCIYLNDNEIQCNLYESHIEKNGKWSKPYKLDFPINENRITTTQPQIVYDSTDQKEYLYFVSNRAGGKGKLDIWKAKLLDNYYDKPINISEVNTAENDITPFYDSKEKTLYFSSLGHGGLGGFDIFKMASDKKITNLGLPYNSCLDDLYYSESAKKDRIYLSSNRPGSLYLDKNNQTCCYDIYQAKLDNPKPIPTISVAKVDTFEQKLVVPAIEKERKKVEKTTIETPIIADVDSPNIKKIITTKSVIQNPEPTKVVEVKKDALTNIVVKTEPNTLKNTTPNKKEILVNQTNTKENLNTLLPITLYYDNDEPDKRTVETTTLKNYQDTYHYYRQKKELFKTEFLSNKKESENESIVKAIDDFFENEVELGMEKLNNFSAQLYQKLNSGKTIEIFIKGYTSPRATSEYNFSLAKRRINCVKNHFKVWNFGALQKYIKSGALIISEKPLGETTAPSDVSDDLENLPASVYDVKASRERRVEIVETIEN